MEYVLILLIGCVAGVVTGLIGASGVMIVVPALVVLGYSVPDAIGASLFINTVAALIVAWTFYQNGNLNLKQGIWIAAGSVVGAQVGSFIAPSIPDVGLGSAFSIFLLISAVTFLIKGIKTETSKTNVLASFDTTDNQPSFDDTNPTTQPSSDDTNTATQMSFILRLLRDNVILSGLLLGFLVGILCGLIGAGGGVMILLILVFIMQYSLHEGIGTSTLIMAFTAASGTIGHALTSNLPLNASLIGSAGTIVGGRFAARFANKINEKALSMVVGGLFVVLAIAMLITTT